MAGVENNVLSLNDVESFFFLYNCLWSSSKEPDLIRWMVGRELSGEYPRNRKGGGEELLRLENVRRNGKEECGCCWATQSRQLRQRSCARVFRNLAAAAARCAVNTNQLCHAQLQSGLMSCSDTGEGGINRCGKN